MTRSQMLRPLAESLARKNKIGIREAESFVKLMFETINDALEEEKVVKVKGLGGFKVTTVKDRESVDVNTGERIVIEGRDKVTFTPDANLRDLVNKPFAQFETVVLNDGVDFSEIDKKFEEQEGTEEVPSEEPMELIDFNDSSEEEASPMVSEETVTSEEGVIAAEEEPSPLVSEETVTPEEEVIAAEEEPSPSVSEEAVIPEEEVIAAEEEPSSMVPEEVDTPEEEVLTTATEEPTPTVSVEPAVSEPKASVSVEENLTRETKSEDQYVTIVNVPICHDEKPEENKEDVAAMEEEVKESRSILKYIALIVSALSFVLVVCLVVLAWQYHKVVLQRNRLLMTVSLYEEKKATPAVDAVVDNKVATEAKQDSARLQDPAEAVAKAEQAVRQEEKRGLEEDKPQAETTKKPQSSKSTTASPAKAKAETKKSGAKTSAASSYDSDPRVRTGAYRIVGVAQTVKVKKGQTLSSISKTYLGPGMECYVEAINGVKEVKEGQSLKIPKLEWKKKR